MKNFYTHYLMLLIIIVRQVTDLLFNYICKNIVKKLIWKFIYISKSILLLAVPRRLFCFGSLLILDMVCRYLSLFLLYKNIKIGKNRCLLLD